MRSYPCKSNIFPYLLLLIRQRLVDDVLDILCVLRIHPDVDLLMGKDDRHAMMHLSKFWGCVLGQDDDLIVIGVQSSDQKVISFFGPEAEGLFLLVPLKVSLKNDHTSVLYDIHKHSLAEQFLNPAIDDHVELALMPPLHVSQLSAILILKVLIFDLFLFVFFYVESVGFYDRDVGGRADVVGRTVELLVCAFFGAGDLEEAEEREGLEHTATHLIYLLIFVKIYHAQGRDNEKKELEGMPSDVTKNYKKQSATVYLLLLAFWILLVLLQFDAIVGFSFLIFLLFLLLIFVFLDDFIFFLDWLDGEISPFQGLLGTDLDNVAEELLQILTSLRTDFIVNHSEVLRLVPSFLLRHFPFVPQIDFIPDQQSEPFASLVLIVQLQP